MSKYCNNPACVCNSDPGSSAYHREFTQEDFCPFCGSDLVSRNSESSALVQGDGNAIYDTHTETHTDQSKHEHVTYIFNGNTAGEKMQSDRKASYREYCMSLIKGGVISRKTRNELDMYAAKLGLEAAEKREIETWAKEFSSQQGADTLSNIDRMTLDFAIEQIRNNSPHAKDHLPKLEALAGAEVDEVQFYYNLLLATESPGSYITRYDNRDADTYWQTYWAYIAYSRNGLQSKAEKLLRELPNWESQSQDNIVLLRCAGWLYPVAGHSVSAENIRMARQALQQCGPVSYLLLPFRAVIEYLIGCGTEMRYLSDSDEYNFYLSRIFGITSKSVKEAAGPVAYTVTAQPLSREVTDTINEAVKSRNDNFSGLVEEEKKKLSRPVGGGVPGASSETSKSPVLLIAVLIVCCLGSWGLYSVLFPKSGNDVNLETVSTGTPPATTGQGETVPAQAVTEAPVSSVSGKQAESAPASVHSQPANPSGATAKPASTVPASGRERASVTPEPKQKAPAEMSAEESYSTGKGAAAGGNYSKAAPYLQAAADRGNAAAKYELALLYQQGAGVAKSPEKAFTYMKAAADAGYAKAFCPLGEMYHGGRGVKKDRAQAEFWYKKAVADGDAKAKRILNNM